MNNETWFRVEVGFSFVVTTKNVRILQKATKEYGIDIPPAKIIIIYRCASGMLEYYIQLEGCNAIKYVFNAEGEKIGIAYGSEDEEDIGHRAMDYLLFNLDYMGWDKILEKYLAEQGICYEE